MRIFKQLLFLFVISCTLVACTTNNISHPITFSNIDELDNFPVPIEAEADQTNPSSNDINYHIKANHNDLVRSYKNKLLEEDWKIEEDTNKTYFVEKNNARYLLIIVKTEEEGLCRITIRMIKEDEKK